MTICIVCMVTMWDDCDEKLQNDIISKEMKKERKTKFPYHDELYDGWEY